MYVFYGTDFHSFDLPLPRNGNEQWALLHEESPKNNFLFSHKETMELFNYTSTFKSSSDFPLTTQYVESVDMITSQKHFQSTSKKNRHRREGGFAPVMYVQSSCEAPSDRDSYVVELMRHIDVDSYGQCLRNKNLPPHIAEPVEGMMHEDFLALAGKYKFVLAMENALCDEYMTEKLWRAIHVGAVPIYYGSSKASTCAWLPNGADSAIFISDYPDPRKLALELKRLDEDDAEYESVLRHKISARVSNGRLRKALVDRKWGVSVDDVIARGSFVSHFECYLCDRLHDALRGNGVTARSEAKATSYGCPEPTPMTARQFLNETSNMAEESPIKMWQDAYWIAKFEGKAMRRLMQTQSEFSQDQLMDLAMELYSLDHDEQRENQRP